jgi:uncharacterized membrane protein YbhN (UPF0104 family)
MSGKIWAWVRLLGGAGILALLMWRLGTAAFLDGLRVIDGAAVLAGLVIGVLTTVLSAWRWGLVAHGIGIRMPLGTAVADYYRALFLNAALPGGVLGDVHRAVRHGRDTGDVGRGIRAVVLERFAGQVVLVVVAVAVLLTIPSPATSGIHLGSVTESVIAIAVLAALVVAIAVRLRRPGGTRFDRVLRATVTDVRFGLFTRGTGPGVALASAGVLAGHLAMFVVAARAAGATASAAQLLPLAMLALLAMTLPINIGGFGPREGVTAWAFAAAGLGATQGLTTAVVYGLLAFVASLPGLGVLIWQWTARLRVPAVVPALPVLPRPALVVPAVRIPAPRRASVLAESVR